MKWSEFKSNIKMIIKDGWIGGIAAAAVFIEMNILFFGKDGWGMWMPCATITIPFMFIVGCFVWVMTMGDRQ